MLCLLCTIFFTTAACLFCWKILFPLAWTLFAYSIGKQLWSKRKLLREAGEWAIITGSTAGIGKAYAEELASDGLNIMLISLNSEELTNVAKEIREKYKVQTKTVTFDFTKTDGYDAAEEEIKKLPSIACLVNNVGISHPHLGEYANTEWINLDFVRDMINCNVNSISSMTRIVLPILLKQNTEGSAIINMGSMSGFRALPYFTLYCSTKAFVQRFTESLSYELEETNVTIQAICPSFVATAMSGMRETSFFIPSAAKFAKSALDMFGVETVCIGYFPHALRAVVLAIHPRIIVSNAKKLYRKVQARKEKQK